MNWTDLPAYFDPIDRIEGIISTFANADWENAYRKNGLLGLATEFAACFSRHNAPTIYVSRASDWRGIDIERLLRSYGVKVWDRGLAGDDLYFCVKRRQARWAKYLLLRAGVPVTRTVIDPRNTIHASRYPVRSLPRSRRPRH